MTSTGSGRFTDPLGSTPLLVLGLVALAAASSVDRARAADTAPAESVRVLTDADGSRLRVGGRDFMIRGMNWDYIPIGDNYMFDLWAQPEQVIVTALEREMSLLRSMHANAIRLYTGIPPRWVKYIHERYGIYVMLNHPMGRYGFTLDGVWHPSVNYSDPAMRAALKADVLREVERYRGTPGVLIWLLGNENNYGLSWSSFEIEALPKGEREAARARHLYSLFEEITVAIHAVDSTHPVGIANGDIQYLDLIARECKSIDILGTNVYRGVSVGDLYQKVWDATGKPVLFSEFGCDAFNAREGREDQAMQARYLIGQWREIYEQSAGKGRVGNAIGGFVFQWSDGWWKYGQDSRLDVHDTHASWPDGGYVEDFVAGDNNMNEEWWGICAKGRPDDRGLFELYPRAAYYALQRCWALDAYAPGTDLRAIDAHFAGIDATSAVQQARGDKAQETADIAGKARVSGVRMELQTISTGGRRITTPPASQPQTDLPSFLGYDRMQSFYTDFEAHPTGNVTGALSVNILGHVAANPINEIFYENRGRTRSFWVDNESQPIEGIERVKVYRASVSWEAPSFQLGGFYRTGHYHWGYEGDFFGLYREANYGQNIDIYNGEAPFGFEMTGKRGLAGWKFAYGQQLWWGANPAVMASYRRAVRGVTATAIYQQDISSQTNITSSAFIPTPRTHKGTLVLEKTRGPLALTVGGIWSGANKVGQPFYFIKADSLAYLDEIFESDAFGAKAKLTYQSGRMFWYALAARMGLVADGGPTAVITFTNWTLKDCGTGNQTNVMSGLLYNLGTFQVGPNVLWQKPIMGPIPAGSPSPAIPRNALDDPFAVRTNREMVGAELMLSYDPTPATWMWAWDNDTREDARFAASLDFTYRHMPTTMDAANAIFDIGGVLQVGAFPGATPPRDLWELRARVVSSLGSRRRLVGTAFIGDGEPNGDDPRLVHRFGADARLAMESWVVSGGVHVNDWGPYDYHRDFNGTFPLQLTGDLAYTLGIPKWWYTNPQTSLGLRAIYRTLDVNSPRYFPDPGSSAKGQEWEVRSYLTFAM
ncbi:MAG TPA: glycoside hydrolase family 2 TIM barrel-domain containing protein [Candidatus Eisenbacteria bacterium]|nr:glycoside hydrolase family 2 TIM barrel-domain containing protein [Candidatus Eisenbacteria bacterium]